MRAAVLVWMLTVTAVNCSPSWRRQPEDVTVRQGANATIFCEMNGLSPSTAVIWQNASQVLFVNEARHHAPSRFSIVTASVAGQFNLRIRNVVAADDGTYQCSVPGLLAKSELTVIVPPGVPQIKLDKNDDLIAGQMVSFTCTSHGGNPAPQMRWLRNGQQVADGHKTVFPRSKFGTTSSVLLWRLGRKDHGAVFTCSVENDGNHGDAFNINLTTSVQYAPELWFTPPGPVRVLEHDSLTLSCVVDGHPAVTNVQWLKNGIATTETGLTYHIVHADVLDHTASYSCVARNKIGDASATISVQVIHAPKLSIPEAVDGRIFVREFQSVNISCVVQATPDVTSVWWQKLGLDAQQNGQTLHLHSVLRDQAGVYMCAATNSLVPTGKSAQTGRANVTVEVVVQYPPGQAHMKQVPKGYIVKGQKVTLSCNVDENQGFPLASFRWTRKGDKQFRHDGPELVLNSARLEDSDVYTCTPLNIVGVGKTVSKQIIINEEAIFKPPLLEKVKYVSITENGLSVMCVVQGTPIPQVTWYKNGKPINPRDTHYKFSSTIQPAEVKSNVVTSILQWKGSGRYPHSESLQISDTGNYTCIANNLVGKEIIRTVKVYVQYAPVIQTGISRVAVDLKQSVSLVCQSHALPHPTIKWYLGDQVITNDQHRHITNSRDQGVFTHQSVLDLKVRSSDLGHYKCVATNSRGNSIAVIELQLKTKPEAPNNVQADNVTWESAVLTWTPGFDGGYPQSFVVVYSSAYQTPTQVNVRGSPEQNTFRIEGLVPATEYTFMVFGRNQLGSGPSSASVSATTRVVDVPPPTDVHYDPNQELLTFTSTSDYCCARILLDHGSASWEVYEHCAPSAGGSIKVTSAQVIIRVNVSLCLERRQDVCSDSVLAVMEVMSNTYPVTMVVVVGVVCGAVIVLLILVLVIVCCRRFRQSKKNPAVNSGSGRPTVVISPSSRSKPLEYFAQNLAVDNAEPSRGAEAGVIPDTSQVLKDPMYVGFGQAVRPGKQYVPVNKPSSRSISSKDHLDIPGRSLPQKRTHSGTNINHMQWKNPPALDTSTELNLSRDSAPHLDPPVSHNMRKPDTYSHSSQESGYSTPTKKGNRKIVHEIVV